MNAERKKKVTSAIQLLTEARDEEQEAYDNLPEGLQSGDKGDTMQTWIDALTEAIDNLEGLE